VSCRYFHHTTGVRMPAIVQSARTQPAATLFDPEERLALWFTPRPTCVPISRIGQAIMGGLCRLEARANRARITRQAFREKSGIVHEHADVLKGAAIDAGVDVADW
jgi:hypothetical protein